MLRLDPAHPPLWRSATELQFGLEPVVRLRDPAIWQQRLVRELEQGLPREALEPVAHAFGAPAGGAAALLAQLRPALERIFRPPPRLVLQVPEDASQETVSALVTAVRSDSVAVEVRRWPDEAPAPSSPPVIVVAHHLVHPQRAASLVGADVPHLPLVLSGSRVQVGPVVVPGTTACLSCLAGAAVRADPAWPVLAAQLAGRRVTDGTPGPLVGEAAHRAVRLLSGEGWNGQETVELILSSAASRIEVRRHLPDADCGCRSPAGSATVADSSVRAPTTPRAFARPG